MTNIFRKIGENRQLKKAQKLILRSRYEEASNILSKFIEQHESSEAYLWLAIAKSCLKDHVEADKIIEKAFSLGLKTPFAKSVKGEILLHLERYDESLKFLSEALESEPDNTRISYLIGLNHLRKGDIDRASEFFEIAIKYDRELVDSRLLAMAELYLHKNR